VICALFDSLCTSLKHSKSPVVITQVGPGLNAFKSPLQVVYMNGNDRNVRANEQKESKQ